MEHINQPSPGAPLEQPPVPASHAEILEIYAVRVVLAALAARLAAGHIVPEEMADLRAIDAQIREAGYKRDYAGMRDLNLAFHDAICRASRNRLLVRFMAQMHEQIRRFPETTFSYPGRAAIALAEHQALLDALQRHDAVTAERVARTNMEHAMQVRVAMLPPDVPHPFDPLASVSVPAPTMPIVPITPDPLATPSAPTPAPVAPAPASNPRTSRVPSHRIVHPKKPAAKR